MVKDKANIFKLDDNEQKEYDKDPFFDCKPGALEYAQGFLGNILNKETPYVLLLEDNFGMGKTHFVTRFTKFLRQNNVNTIYFSAWENDYIPDPFLAFSKEIITFIKNKYIGKKICSKGKDVFDKIEGVAEAISFNLPFCTIYCKTIIDRFKKEDKVQIPSGIILYGPDGLGKTLFARTFAQESKCNIVEVNTAKSNSQLLKNIESAAIEAEKLYKTTNGTKRTIIFLDNLDLNSDKFSQLKEFISNCSEKYQSTLLITTNNNYPAKINKPGVNKVFMEVPNTSNLENIFRFYLKDFSRNEKINYTKLANELINNKSLQGFYSVSRIKTAIENYSKSIMRNQNGFSQETLISLIKTMGPDISMAQLEKYGKNALSRIKR